VRAAAAMSAMVVLRMVVSRLRFVDAVARSRRAVRVGCGSVCIRYAGG
jgi:hypothetical protein